MTKYVIKATYIEGDHKGKTYFLNKGGYVVSNLEYVWQDSSYDLRTCKAVCTKYAKHNAAQHKAELAEREYRERKGKENSKYRLYYLMSYEPYAIETVDA